ncbi:helix-turn-helix domain-containing protein [Mucilaginibacter gracilis]|uniref:helix-turn-helix domain-containing protein n=1 Tax=Mucilaginibacter gracilis TaxID=423350 RepID=UPI000EAC549B|nr:AraC family transcriptional regulator [Mucilaginibacter gracilis]
MLTDNNSEPPPVFEYFHTGYTPPDLQQVISLQNLIEVHFRQERDLEFYAGKMHLTLPRLNNLTRAHLGKTLYELLQDRLHEEAEKLLKHTTLTAKDIAYELGMNDPAYFFRCFKRVTGMRPREFRKQARMM